MLNQGYSYREQLGTKALGHTTLSYLVSRYSHSDKETWTCRLARGEVLIDDAPANGNEILHAGQILVWNRPGWQEADVPKGYTVIYEDEYLLVVNKPSGLPTLPAGGFLNNTLLAVIHEAYPEAKPLHRLGRATSGLVVFARNSEVARVLSARWKENVRKTYRALSQGVADQDQYEISVPIGPVAHPNLGTVFAASPKGKSALSLAKVHERRSVTTVFTVQLITGRPHQIRIHLASIGHPLVGDPVYTFGANLLDPPGLPGEGGYLLHAEKLAFVHPVSREKLELSAPTPKGWEATESEMFNERIASPNEQI